MPSQQAQVLQEFLVSLGFSIDTVGQAKLDGTLGKVLKSTATVSKSVIGIATAAQAMVVAVTYEFERLYYASKRVGDSTKAVQGFAYGARQIGISAEHAEGALEGMAAQIRTNPGMSALFQSLVGEKPSGTVKSMMDLLTRLRSMPYFMGAQWAEQFGISEDMFNMLMQPGALEKMQAAAERRNQINEQLGVTTEQLAEASVEYKNQLREITANAETLSALIAGAMMDSFKGLNEAIMAVIRLMTGKSDKQAAPQFDAQGKPLTPAAAIKGPSYIDALMSQMGMHSRLRGENAWSEPDLVSPSIMNKSKPIVRPGAGSPVNSTYIPGTSDANYFDPNDNKTWRVPGGVQLERDKKRLTMLQRERANSGGMDTVLLDKEIAQTQRVIAGGPAPAEKDLVVNVTNNINAPGGDPKAVSAAAEQGTKNGIDRSVTRNLVGPFRGGGPAVAAN